MVGLVLGLAAGLTLGNHHAWPAYTIAVRRLAKKEHLLRKLYVLTPTGVVEARALLAQRRPAPVQAQPGQPRLGTAFARWLGLGTRSTPRSSW